MRVRSLLAAGACAALVAAAPSSLFAQDAGPVRRLSVDDAVSLALEQNLGITIERMNPQIQDLAVALAKTAWYSVPGTVLLYGAVACHLILALRTIYTRQHWRLPLIEYVRLGAGFSLPLLLIGHVVTTRLGFSLHGADPRYASVVASLVLSGNEGWQLALLAPGWLHGSELYILVAGKMYPDPTPVKPRTFAIASSAMVTRSPTEISMSSSRRRGCGEICLAKANNSLVVLPMADTTATTWCPS